MVYLEDFNFNIELQVVSRVPNLQDINAKLNCIVKFLDKRVAAEHDRFVLVWSHIQQRQIGHIRIVSENKPAHVTFSTNHKAEISADQTSVTLVIFHSIFKNF